MLGEAAFAAMKDGVRILNFSRAGLVDSDAMLAALASGKVATYVVDFPTDEMLGVANVVAIPHLGASTPESEDNCAIMAVRQLEDYLVNGNIQNSVNMPNLSQEWSGIARICLIHKNIPAMLTKITTVLSDDHINVENLTNKSRKEYAYTIVDVDTRINDAVADELRAIEGMVRVRVINH
jgi:D-3-phosphoglycerate dehydrogenase